MAQKIKVMYEKDRYIRRCNDGYDTCNKVDATIFKDEEIDQVMEDLFHYCYTEICEPEKAEE